jgi:hypothetical protein
MPACISEVGGIRSGGEGRLGRNVLSTSVLVARSFRIERPRTTIG